jgi:hypothetical protein
MRCNRDELDPREYVRRFEKAVTASGAASQIDFLRPLDYPEQNHGHHPNRRTDAVCRRNGPRRRSFRRNLEADPGKWRNSPGAPEGRKSQVLKLEALTNHYHQTQYTLNGRPVMRADGKTVATADFFLDGKEYQMGMMTIVGQRIDERHFKETRKGRRVHL